MRREFVAVGGRTILLYMALNRERDRLNAKRISPSLNTSLCGNS